jgi:hypothetical protein
MQYQPHYKFILIKYLKANNLTPVDLLTGDLFEFPKDHITASQPITRPTSATPANIDLKNIFDFKKMSQTVRTIHSLMFFLI